MISHAALRCMLIALVGANAASTPLRGDEAARIDSPATTPAPTESHLRSELLSRSVIDRDVRRQLIAAVNERGLDLSEAALEDRAVESLAEEISRVDADNRKWLRSILDERGWPLISEVGHDGANAAFLIAQHADADRDFQKRCLELMQAAPKDQIALRNLALLTDRVRLAEGKMQLYGSQAQQKDGRWIAHPTADPEDLDRRRAEMGLPSMAEYLKLLDQIYRRKAVKIETPNEGL